MNPQPSWGGRLTKRRRSEERRLSCCPPAKRERTRIGDLASSPSFPEPVFEAERERNREGKGASCCVFFAFSVRPKTQQPRQDSCRGCGIYLGVDLLSHANIRSIMGDEALNFRVRNGFGCTRLSLDTKEISKYIIDRDEEVPFENKTHGLLVSVSSTPHSAYTSDLSTRSSTWALQDLRLGVLISRQASRLDAFSGYPFHT